MQLSPREVLQINSQVSMVVDLDHESVFFKADVPEQCVLVDGRELFSFGAGSWYDGSDAKELMEQGDGKWLKCFVTFPTLVVLEAKRLPEHLTNLDCVEKPVPLKTLLLQLEDAGEAGNSIFACISGGVYHHHSCLPRQGQLLADHCNFTPGSRRLLAPHCGPGF